MKLGFAETNEPFMSQAQRMLNKKEGAGVRPDNIGLTHFLPQGQALP